MGVRLETSQSAAPASQLGVSEGCGVVGDGLRRMFDDVVAAPMPHSLVALCEALEDAFERGKLASSSPERTSRR